MPPPLLVFVPHGFSSVSASVVTAIWFERGLPPSSISTTYQRPALGGYVFDKITSALCCVGEPALSNALREALEEVPAQPSAETWNLKPPTGLLLRSTI